jgi:hypothetical protein
MRIYRHFILVILVWLKVTVKKRVAGFARG